MGTTKKTGPPSTPGTGSVTVTLSVEHANTLLTALTQAIHSSGSKTKAPKGKPK